MRRGLGETDRQTDRQTQKGRHRQTHTDREMADSQTDRHRQTDTDRQTDRHSDRQTERQTNRWTDRQTDTDRETGRTDRQTTRWADRQTGRQTDRYADRYSEWCGLRVASAGAWLEWRRQCLSDACGNLTSERPRWCPTSVVSQSSRQQSLNEWRWDISRALNSHTLALMHIVRTGKRRGIQGG